ncbi:MAG: EamA family transporter [Bacteroidetes bacterium]|nr:MAG: EamA family transporter [Bacteroidota bacterium]
MIQKTADRYLIPMAFFAIYILWGAIYLANYYAIQDIPPFLMTASRFLVAGALLGGWARLIGHPAPTPRQWKNAILSGFLFLVLGTGSLIWSLQFVDTGIASLIVALEPLIIMLMVWKMRGHRPNYQSWAGIALGIAGMFILVSQDRFLTNENTLWGIGALLFSTIAWGYATLFVGDKDLPVSKIMTSGIQMLAGGIILMAVSWLAREWDAFTWEAVRAKAWWGWVFSVLGGSIIAFSAFNYLLVRVSPEKVSTSTYVNPIVALLLGWQFNNEILSGQSVVAACLMLLGVFFIVSKKG